MTPPAPDSSPAFTCLRCGNCCRHTGEVRLEKGEIETIAASLGIDAITFTSRYTRLRDDRRGLSLLDQPDGSCIFLSIPLPRTLNPEPTCSACGAATAGRPQTPPPSPPPSHHQPFPMNHSQCLIQSAKPRQCQNFPLTWKYENLTAICPASLPEPRSLNPNPHPPSSTIPH